MIKDSKLEYFKVRWPAWLALIIISLLYEALPPALYWGPPRVMMDIVAILILLMIFMHWHLRIARVLGIIVNILVTLYMIISIERIVAAVLQGNIAPSQLLLSSMVLWGTNIFVFALWYWSLDAGGPQKRSQKTGHGIFAFLFPQEQLCSYQLTKLPESIIKWEPGFVDYLFLAFNTSTAFSPTDTPVITRWAKFMCMIQSMISLTIVVMLAARAINILSPAGVPLA
jgi:hypothetical protein